MTKKQPGEVPWVPSETETKINPNFYLSSSWTNTAQQVHEIIPTEDWILNAFEAWDTETLEKLSNNAVLVLIENRILTPNSLSLKQIQNIATYLQEKYETLYPKNLAQHNWKRFWYQLLGGKIGDERYLAYVDKVNRLNAEFNEYELISWVSPKAPAKSSSRPWKPETTGSMSELVGWTIPNA
jgi:hypothetical protein